MAGKVSFEGIGEMMATFYAQEGVERGQVVAVRGDSTVGPCGAGEPFDGVATSVKDGCAGVQVEGFAEVKCADEAVAPGRVALAADGAGGVKKAESGRSFLVVSAGDGLATVKL